LGAVNLVALGVARAAGHREPAPKTFDMVLEGGGIKAAAFAGAVQALDEAQVSYRHIIGSSAGAIVATFLAAGYKPARMLEILTEHTPEGHHLFSTFLVPPDAIPAPAGRDGKPAGLVVQTTWKVFCTGLIKSTKALEPLAKHNPKYAPEKFQTYVSRTLSLLSTGSAASDGAFLSWMEHRLKEAGFDPEGNLAAFHKATSERGIQLSVVATDLTARRPLVLNHRTAPDLPAKWAVRMSMGIPLVWNEVEWQAEWGKYRGDALRDEQGGHRMVDGGVLSNFPLRYLVDDRHFTDQGVIGPFRKETSCRPLGLLLDETKEAAGAPSHEERRRMTDRLPVYQSISRLVDTMSSAWDQEAIDEHKDKICRIGVKGYDTLDFDMEQNRLDRLVASGRDCVRQYLATLAEI
jgi:predicted acylesterase/phospholipase RssA